jgi:hypothetical protein
MLLNNKRLGLRNFKNMWRRRIKRIGDIFLPTAVMAK